MGSLSFRLPEILPAGADAALRRICIAGGFDLNPVPTKISLDSSRLIASREVNESGYLMAPWPVEGFGDIVTTTATLREQETPYSLLVELARGKLNQVRCQTVEWQSLGLRTTREYDADLKAANQQFVKAVLSPQARESDEHATRVLTNSYALADRLVKMYIAQVLETRHGDEGKLRTQFSARVTRPISSDRMTDYRKAFNAFRIPFQWCDIERSEANYDWSYSDPLVASAVASGLPVTGGPIIDLAPGMIPTWAAGWQGDLPTLAAFMCDFVETVLNRYRGKIKRWQICAGFNHNDGYGLSDDDRLRLAARILDAAANVDPDLEFILGIAQPWGDYLASEDQTIPPFQFADDLVRNGLRIGAVDLEIAMGSQPRASWTRDLLETCRILDLFGLLGLPLEVTMSVPSSTAADPAAASLGQSITAGPGSGPPTPQQQADWAAGFASLAMCKPHVRSVIWSPWSDADPHTFPNGGLLDLQGKFKPIFQRFSALRSDHLA